MGETSKALHHRLLDGWHDRYAPQHLAGIDIGCERDIINQTFRRYDYIYGDGDATHMSEIGDELFYTVYCSHVLEHIEDYKTALFNWWRILKYDGHLIILVPHRDLYEKRPQPPSIWNSDHKWFFLPDEYDPPRTLNFMQVIRSAFPNGRLVSYEILNDGWASKGDDIHSEGEYSIEAIIQKVR